jgi:hypothetical protein
MDRRNLNLDVPMTRERRRQLGRTAMAPGGPSVGYLWKGDRPDEIRVLARDESAPSALQADLTNENRYGVHEREVARFVFNDGRPYAELEPPPQPMDPAITLGRDRADERELEGWVRNRWHDLVRQAGLRYQ